MRYDRFMLCVFINTYIHIVFFSSFKNMFSCIFCKIANRD